MTPPVTDSASSARKAIFGGSFDPIHRGHLAMAEAAREKAGLAAVVFVPAAVSPFKRGTVATGPQRREMIEIALAESALDWASVSDSELNRPAPSYSWETARHFAGIEPETEWYWILGTDQWEQIDQWAEPDRLRESLHFIIFTRLGQVVRDRSGWRFTAVPFEHPASSTAIREDFAEHREWLASGVAAYCEREGLYRAAQNV